MNATLLGYRRGRHTQRTNQLLLEVEGCDTKTLASKFIGKRVIWRSPAGKEIYGKITQPHGNKGVLRVRFSRGLPGDAAPGKAEIVE